MKRRVAWLGLLLSAPAAAQVPPGSTQLITAWAVDSEASHAELQRWQRRSGGWTPVGPPVPARLGRDGLAWGAGLHPAVDGRPKLEGDRRAPMGIFALGDAFSELEALPARWPTHRTSPRDLWVEDPLHPAYNTHVQVPPDRPLTAWERSQQMHLGDPAHRLKLVVGHNTSPPEPGRGSAIFLHIWRDDGNASTAGCTAIPADALVDLLDWLDPAAQPVYALLDRAAWAAYGAAWGLPPLPPPHTSAPALESP